MARLRMALGRAAALHRQAVAITLAAARSLDRHSPEPAHTVEQHELAERLRAAAAELAPGWLGAPLDAAAASAPLGGHDMPPYVRIGTAQPLDDARFPAIVPLLTHGHLTIDADARDPRVAGLLRAVLLRLLAAAPAGTLHVRAVDAAGAGTMFARFAPVADSLMPPPVTDRAGLAAVLAEAEQWVRQAADPPARTERRRGLSRPTRGRLLLLVIASLPELVDGQDLARIAALAQAGPAAGLHLVVAGWPPPPLTAETTQGLLPLATAIAIRNPYAVVGPPPGATFGGTPERGVLNAPVYLDDDPPAELVDRVCRELAEHAEAAGRLRLTDLMPDGPEWVDSAADGLAVVVGFAADAPVTLRFNDLTPHWMIGGRSGAGKTAFLMNVLFGLATRYPPDELTLYLLDFKEGVSFTELTPTRRDPTWLPHARAVGIESDREYGLAVLRELEAEMTRRAGAFKQAGVAKFADLRHVGNRLPRLPRLLCVIDEFQVLFAGTDPTATEAVALLESLARKGRSYGIHLVLASQTARGIESLYAKRDSIFGQFPVRIALPGGGDVLDPTNEAAAGLPIGAGVVNTAGGLGGPRGAVRGHEKTVHFPDPYAEPDQLAALRHALWNARPAGSTPPHVFAGYAEYHLDEAAIEPTSPPTVLLGRTIDVELTSTAYRLDGTPGRHLAVLGPSRTGLDLLDAAARSVAAQHEPGSTRFLLIPPVAAGFAGNDTAQAAERLATALAAGGHRVQTFDADRAVEELADGRAGYLVLAGADAAALPAAALRAVLRDGPARGQYVFGWWRGLRRFTEDVGPAARDEVAGLVFLNVPGADVSVLLGRPVDWSARPNRALLYDRHADRTTVFVPFVRRAAPDGVTP